MSCGGYPLGAQYDPRAPWNEIEPTMVKCEACNGNGKHWYAYNIDTDRETECTETTWNTLPETEDMAERINRHEHYIKGDVEICDVCGGFGEYELDYEY